MTRLETVVTLNLTEYESSIITGALLEMAERWGEGEAYTANYLRKLIRDQLPAEWTN